MDQLGTILRDLKRHHFWVLCGLILVASLVSWYVAVGALASEEEENRGRINSGYSKVTEVGGEENHFNDETTTQLETVIVRRRQEVLDAWGRMLAHQQKQADGKQALLSWPDFSNDFTTMVKKNHGFLPFENPAYRTDAEDNKIDPRTIMPNYLLEAYRDYIQEELPKVAEVIGAIWTPSLDSFAMNVRGEEEEPRSFRSNFGDENSDSSVIVDWNSSDQQRIQLEHFDWSAASAFPPTHLQVMYAQEDLWVLQALMKIIKRTNGQATVRHNALIKGIDTIRIGKSAASPTGKVWRPIGTGQTDDSIPEPEPEGPGMTEDGLLEEGGMREVPDPADERYVDANYKPIPLDELLNTTDPFVKVVKRLPVRMRLKMEQRAIAKMLAECANSELTVEVRQLRMNPPNDMDFGAEGAFSHGEEPGRALFFNTRNDRDHSWITAPFPLDVTVEIFGIIYIFNDVDESALGELGDDG